jgi:tetratricopeptide (TPR) repeat protein
MMRGLQHAPQATPGRNFGAFVGSVNTRRGWGMWMLRESISSLVCPCPPKEILPRRGALCPIWEILRAGSDRVLQLDKIMRKLEISTKKGATLGVRRALCEGSATLRFGLEILLRPGRTTTKLALFAKTARHRLTSCMDSGFSKPYSGTTDAIQNYTQARALYQKESDRLREAQVLRSLGRLQSDLGEGNLAREDFESALGIFQNGEDRLDQAEVLKSLGDLESDLGNNDAAHGTTIKPTRCSGMRARSEVRPECCWDWVRWRTS